MDKEILSSTQLKKTGKLAFLFAGQGAQHIGMGQDFYNKFDYVKDIYEKASDILGFNLKDVCFLQNELINQTVYTQPAILATSIAIYTVVLKELGIKPDIVQGFSLGEYSALWACGVFDFKTILNLVKNRAQFMQEACDLTKGKMAAIIGIQREVLKKLCKKESVENEFVQIANYNCSSQYVVGGTEKAVANLCEKALKFGGAKRAIILNVSGAFHTPLMTSASNKMYDIIKNTKYLKPQIPIVMNCNAKFLKNCLPKLMKKQIESSVYFEDSIKFMINNGVETFVEIGPGNVLSGLVKKIDSEKTVISINKLSDLENLKGVL